MTYNVFSGALNPAQSNPIQINYTYVYFVTLKRFPTSNERHKKPNTCKNRLVGGGGDSSDTLDDEPRRQQLKQLSTMIRIRRDRVRRCRPRSQARIQTAARALAGGARLGATPFSN